MFTSSGSESTKTVSLPKSIFGIKTPNNELLKKSYLRHLANSRSNSAVTLDRSEVRGGGRKPWRQKGTGRARVGSIRSPLWRSGGVTFGPTNQRNYSINMSKSEKRCALKHALSLAATDKKIKVIDGFKLKEGKTKEVVALLDKLGAHRNTLVVDIEKSPELIRATSNIQRVFLCTAKYLSVYRVLNADDIIITKPALEEVEKMLGEDNG
ncbi:50S ribosomal protein L4 [Candidatus Saccharibacteria bacterium CPR2]|nr:50S ribosomal protein L4 [Candidatus Saccharibacteria bacterium CPR2]